MRFILLATLFAFGIISCERDSHRDELSDLDKAISIIGGNYSRISSKMNVRNPVTKEAFDIPDSIEAEVHTETTIDFSWENLAKPISVSVTGEGFHINSNGVDEDTVMLTHQYSFRLYGEDAQYLELGAITNGSISYPEGFVLGIYRRDSKEKAGGQN